MTEQAQRLAPADLSLRDRIERRLRRRGRQRQPRFRAHRRARADPRQRAAAAAVPAEDLARAAVLVPLVDRPEGLHGPVHAALVAAHESPGPGELPGRADRGGAIAGPWEAAVREAQEEIGLAGDRHPSRRLPARSPGHLGLRRDTGCRLRDARHSSSGSTGRKSTTPSRRRSSSCSTAATTYRRRDASAVSRSRAGTFRGRADRIWGATAGMLVLVRRPADRAPELVAIGRLLEIMRRLRDPRARLSLGSRADLGEHRARTRSRRPTSSRMRSARAIPARA